MLPNKSGPQPIALPARTETPTSWSDRRRSPRYSLTAPAEVTELRTKATIGGRCTDLSSGGCYVDTLSPFPQGTEVRIRIVQEPRSFLCEATVAFGQMGMGMGLAFTTIMPSELRKLTEWLQDLSCESLPSQQLPMASNSSPQEETLKADRNVLNQLISLLIRKRVINDQEGTELLRELFR